MAFSTIQGSGGAPDSFVGTSGVDAIAVIDSDGGYFLGAQASNDTIALTTTGNPLYSRAVGNATLKGGSGDDAFTFTSANATTYVSAFFNGNANEDTFTLANGDSFLTTTLKGGQGEDTITTGVAGTASVTSSVLNGNKNDDTVRFDGVVTTSSVYGGQGDDAITLGGATAVTNSVISGDVGHDTIIANVNTKSLNGSSILGGAGNDTITLTQSGNAATDTLYVNGNDGVDVIQGTDTGTAQIFGGSGVDTITGNGADATITGGNGIDTITLANGGIERVSYSAIDQGGASASATLGTAVATGDTVTGFLSTQDFLNFASGSLVGTAAAAAADGGDWNMNTSGVAFDIAASGALANYNDVATAVGNVVGDAGDVGYYVQEITAAAAAAGGAPAVNGVYNIYQVTLGTTRAAGAATALNAGDNIGLVAAVTIETGAVNLGATNFSFLG